MTKTKPWRMSDHIRTVRFTSPADLMSHYDGVLRRTGRRTTPQQNAHVEAWRIYSAKRRVTEPSTIQDILQKHADLAGTTVSALRGASRHGKLIKARHDAIVEMKQRFPDLKVTKIARLLNRTHSTINYVLSQTG